MILLIGPLVVRREWINGTKVSQLHSKHACLCYDPKHTVLPGEPRQRRLELSFLQAAATEMAKKYQAHAIHLPPEELARKLAKFWVSKQAKMHRWLEWWEPKSIPQIADAVCRDLFHFDPDCLDKAEKCVIWTAILDAQAYFCEQDVIEEACLSLLFLAEEGRYLKSLAMGAQETLSR